MAGVNHQATGEAFWVLGGGEGQSAKIRLVGRGQCCCRASGVVVHQLGSLGKVVLLQSPFSACDDYCREKGGRMGERRAPWGSPGGCGGSGKHFWMPPAGFVDPG